jgi:hypothetical protein
VHSPQLGENYRRSKNFSILLLTGGVFFGNFSLDCCRFTYNCGRFTCDCRRFTCDCGRLSCGGGHFPFGQRLSGGGHVGSSRPDANFHFGLFATGG